MESLLTVLPELPKPAFYYEAAKNKYWILNADQHWMQMIKDDVCLLLEKAGYNTKPPKGKSYSQADDYLSQVRTVKSISFAAPIAGQQAGIRETPDARYLVTRSPNLITPSKGDWSDIKILGERLFGVEQWEYVLGWSKTAVTGLYANKCTRGQILVLAGAAGCGKSFWQKQIITPMLGGRLAKPLQFMQGQTSFNEDIIKAEHLMLEDENAHTDMKSRQAFGAAIKNFTVNVSQRMHGKGKEAGMVDSSHWVSMSLNDEPESLMVLPPIDAAIEDKIMLLLCEPAITMEWPEGGGPALEARTKEQMPAFIQYLLEDHVIRTELRELRMGIKAYHNPKILRDICSTSPEAELELVVDRVYREVGGKKGTVQITSTDLHSTLVGHPDLGRQAAKMFYSSILCGKYLSRLSKQKPKKFYRSSDRRGSPWVIDWSVPGEDD